MNAEPPVRPAASTDAAAVAEVDTTVERTDGSTNEEREPDVRYAWRGQTP